MELIDRFLKYVTFDTQSSETSNRTPSTPGQVVLAEALKEELTLLGLEEISLDENGYLMATLPSNSERELPVVGFIAHLDTSPDLSGNNVKPRIVQYNGEDITLSKEKNVVLSERMFPELHHYIGQELIVTDGNTLLGADDKAGVAAIISAVAYLINHPEIEHGKIRIGFTPDEEIGQGADHFDVEKFGCQWAYTIDGGMLGELEYESFNAAVATLAFKGLNVHPGTAKDTMINASLLAMEYASWLPTEERPERTEGYEGFYHLTQMQGTVEEASLSYLIRDHNKELFEKKKGLLIELTSRMNDLHPDSTTLTIRDQYFNMREVIEQDMSIVELADQAMRELGITPISKPIRGGTDGSRLSFMGLPCPNIFTGGHNFHGRYEYIPVQSLEKSCLTIVKIAELTARNY